MLMSPGSAKTVPGCELKPGRRGKSLNLRRAADAAICSGKTGFVLFSALVSGMMSLIVSGISTMRSVGPVPDFLAIWMDAWLPSWSVAFPAIMFVVPFVRRMLARLVIRR